jgi:hypothetical protein
VTTSQRWAYLEVYVFGDDWADSTGRTGTLPAAPTPEHPQFRPHTLVPVLDALGAERWEVAGVVATNTNNYHLILKRPAGPG